MNRIISVDFCEPRHFHGLLKIFMNKVVLADFHELREILTNLIVSVELGNIHVSDPVIKISTKFTVFVNFCELYRIRRHFTNSIVFVDIIKSDR